MSDSPYFLLQTLFCSLCFIVFLAESFSSLLEFVTILIPCAQCSRSPQAPFPFEILQKGWDIWRGSLFKISQALTSLKTNCVLSKQNQWIKTLCSILLQEGVQFLKGFLKIFRCLFSSFSYPSAPSKLYKIFMLNIAARRCVTFLHF